MLTRQTSESIMRYQERRIRELEAQLAAREWTKVVPETMPLVDTPVLVTWGDPDDVVIAFLSPQGRWWATFGLCAIAPTHWMLRPAPPVGKEE